MGTTSLLLSYGELTLFFLSSFIISALVCLLLKVNLFFFDNERRSAFVNELKPELLFISTFVFLFSTLKYPIYYLTENSQVHFLQFFLLNSPVSYHLDQ